MSQIEELAMKELENLVVHVKEAYEFFSTARNDALELQKDAQEEAERRAHEAERYRSHRDAAAEAYHALTGVDLRAEGPTTEQGAPVAKPGPPPFIRDFERLTR